MCSSRFPSLPNSSGNIIRSDQSNELCEGSCVTCELRQLRADSFSLLVLSLHLILSVFLLFCSLNKFYLFTTGLEFYKISEVVSELCLYIDLNITLSFYYQHTIKKSSYTFHSPSSFSLITTTFFSLRVVSLCFIDLVALIIYIPVMNETT